MVAADYIGVGMHVPENEEISWTAIPFEEYVGDMELRGEDLTRQVAVDVPRMRVTLQICEGDPIIRVSSGEVVEALLRRVIPHRTAESVLAFLTQTSLAAPMRALARIMPDNVVVSEHDAQRDMTVAIMVRDSSRVSIRIRKTLALRSTESLEMIRTIRLVVEASTTEEFVMVGVV